MKINYFMIKISFFRYLIYLHLFISLSNNIKKINVILNIIYIIFKIIVKLKFNNNYFKFNNIYIFKKLELFILSD